MQQINRSPKKIRLPWDLTTYRWQVTFWAWFLQNQAQFYIFLKQTYSFCITLLPCFSRLGIGNSFPGPHTSRCEVCPELSYLEEMQLTWNVVQCLSRDQDCPATAHSTQHKAGARQVLRAVVEGSGHCIPDGD